MSKIKIPFPKLKEQQKIATCLSSLDEVITAEGKKLEALKEHKKGLLQNLFPQEGETVPKLRFPEFENSGEWVEKTLGEMSENVMYGMNAAAVEFDGENKYIRITDIDENTSLFSPNPLTSPDGQLDDKYFLKVGDILFARTGASVGKSYLHQKENGRVYFAGFLIRFTIKNAIPYFIYLQTLTEQYQKWVSKTSMRSGQPGINAEEYKSYSIYLPPTIKEQQKIADCLSSLDEFITAQTQKIEYVANAQKMDCAGFCFLISTNKMDKFRNKYRIPSTRLQPWDYRWAGAYFITICTANRIHYLGEMENRKMVLSPIACWPMCFGTK
jgi:type I restriction enzyme S subunit